MAVNNPTDDQLKVLADLEMEMMTDMFNRMSNACHKKCIPPKYRDPDLTKGEAVCLDRCVAKYFDIHERIAKKLMELQQQEGKQINDQLAQMQQQGQIPK